MRAMFRNSFRPCRLLAAVLAGLLIVLPALAVQASKTDLVTIAASRQMEDPTLVLSMGKADIVDIVGPVSDVMIANPSIASVTIINPNRLYVAGRALGDTNIIALDAMGETVARLNVHVKVDEAYLQKLVNEYFPDETIYVRALLDQIILSGTVSSPSVSAKVQSLVMHAVTEIQDVSGSADEYLANFLEVRGEQQVMLRVKIVEASRNVLKELGVRTSANNPASGDNAEFTIFDSPPSDSVFQKFSRSGLHNQAFLAGLTQDPISVTRGVIDTGLKGVGLLELAINALAQENMVNILAEPNLTTISGEQAGFLAGGEFPVPDGRDLQGNIKVQFRQFGVSLNFVPRVVSADRISLQLNTEVSSLDFTKGITIADTVVPALDIRRAGTTVELPTGGSLMIAGILKSDALTGMSGLPGIMNTPVLGRLISSQRFERKETELLIIVTPYLVTPYASKEFVQEVPTAVTHPLSVAFKTNIQRLFGSQTPDLFEGDERYGYLLH